VVSNSSGGVESNDIIQWQSGFYFCSNSPPIRCQCLVLERLPGWLVGISASLSCASLNLSTKATLFWIPCIELTGKTSHTAQHMCNSTVALSPCTLLCTPKGQPLPPQSTQNACTAQRLASATTEHTERMHARRSASATTEHTERMHSPNIVRR